MRVHSTIRAGRRGRLRTSESVAGWIFADMLLVLFILGLGTAIPVEPPEPVPVPKPEPKIIVGMKTEPVKLTFDVSAPGLLAGDSRAVKRVREVVGKQTGGLKKEGSRAALVLIFGGGATASLGQEVATKVYPHLNKASPQVFRRGTASRNFWDGSLAYGQVRLEVFVFTTAVDGK